LEATGKKVKFQQKVCDALGLKNVTVVQGRAEALAHEFDYRQRFDVVCARALAAMPMLAELSLGFVRPDGCAIYWKGSRTQDELKSAESAIQKMGGQPQAIASYVLGATPEQNTFSLIVCDKTGPTPKEYPRPFGMIKRKPITGKK
jgi:16S rRNA (guanine527-N7)-methyltransferase